MGWEVLGHGMGGARPWDRRYQATGWEVPGQGMGGTRLKSAHKTLFPTDLDIGTEDC